MPYSRPTLTTLRSNVASDIAADLPGIDTVLRYSNVGAVGKAQAGLANGLYGYLDFCSKQMVPFTSSDEYLAGWAALKSTYIKAAASASGSITFNATGTTPVPAGTEITRDDGATFTSMAEATPSDTTVVVPVMAADAGADGNTAVGTTMYLSVGISGISPNGTVTTAISGGADIETQDEFLSRTLQAYQATPAGGSESDYVTWAEAVSGVTRAWCVPRGYGPGTVVVLFMMDDVRSAEGGFPQGTNGLAASDNRDVTATGDQLILANALAADQPADPRVYAVAPTQNQVSFTISGLGTSPADTLQSAISDALSSALTSYGVMGGTTEMGDINAALATVSGASSAVIISMSSSAGSISPGPIGNIVSNALSLPVLGTVAYV